MKLRAVLAAMAIGIMLVACGGGGGSTITNPTSRAWSEALSNSSGQQLGSFTFTMMQNSTALTGSNMNFANLGSLDQCFGAGSVMSGQMGQGMMNGGTVTMTVSWTAPNNAGTNTMTMQGNMAMGMASGSGSFTLTGQTPGCMSEQGTYTMTPMM
jgi:hypothetical protein